MLFSLLLSNISANRYVCSQRRASRVTARVMYAVVRSELSSRQSDVSDIVEFRDVVQLSNLSHSDDDMEAINTQLLCRGAFYQLSASVSMLQSVSCRTDETQASTATSVNPLKGSQQEITQIHFDVH